LSRFIFPEEGRLVGRHVYFSELMKNSG
jgi:hypothetical protein